MQVCDRKHWTLSQFRSLTSDEQARWLAWEYRREQHKHEAVDRVIDALDTYRKDPDMKYAEQHTAATMRLLLCLMLDYMEMT